MFILRNILFPLQQEFNHRCKGDERGVWFVYTLLAVITHFTSSRSANLLRCLQILFGLSLSQRRFYIFMASSKLPWSRLWTTLWSLIPNPTTKGRLLLALDDTINPKTGKKIFGCASFFDHAAKTNQSKYPWSQNVVSIGLLKIGRVMLKRVKISARFIPESDYGSNRVKISMVNIGRRPVIIKFLGGTTENGNPWSQFLDSNKGGLRLGENEEYEYTIEKNDTVITFFDDVQFYDRFGYRTPLGGGIIFQNRRSSSGSFGHS